MSGGEQLIDNVATVSVKGCASQARANPFVKWAGGKRGIIHELRQCLPNSFERYHEPFVGGGALFYAVENQVEKAYLSDANAELMIAYRIIQTECDRLIEELQKHKRLHNKQYYIAVRKQDRLECPVKLAARFIYLNKTSYNGLYRVNSSGLFNVPMGKYKNPGICDENNLRAVSKALCKADIKWQTFQKVEPESGDFIYCDPPYDQTYDNYTEARFDGMEQRNLADYANQWHKAGAKVMISNSDTDMIREFYKHRYWRKTLVSAPRAISCTIARRGKTSELIITNYASG